MTDSIVSKLGMQFRKWGFLFAWGIIAPIFFFVAFSDTATSEYKNWWAWSLYFIIFGLIPILDHIIGVDTKNHEEELEKFYVEDKSYRWITFAIGLLWLVVVLPLGMYCFMNNDYSTIGKIGWIISIGTLGGVMAITIAHELVHKDTWYEDFFGGVLLSSVMYPGFKIEHIRGHHVHVSTPEDASSSRYNQSLYAFLPHALIHNFINAWQLEVVKLERKNLKVWSWNNELIRWYTLCLVFTIASYAVFGIWGAIFFVVQGYIAAVTLEIVNYVEHYGLHRRKLENGRYERTTHHHSWNSPYILTNALLFNLQRHSDHHAFARRRYQVLRHFDDSPQLPGGYATMYLLALLPPLWKKVMNPRVEAYYQDDLSQLQD